MDVSIIIPVHNGGEVLRNTLASIRRQQTDKEFEIVAIDSGSKPETMDILRDAHVRLIEIANQEFNHGLTRDLGAEEATGEFLIFINQDAEPGDERWLDLMVQPMLDDDRVLATQGRIRERSDGPRFFWRSGGPRFYFTSEAREWIARFHEVGFSTVNCAMRRDVWSRNRFGDCYTMEDKDLQRRIHQQGHEIVYAEGWVLHSHDYDVAQLRRRCRDEGYGWQLVGVEYTRWQAVRDMLRPVNYALLLAGLVSRHIRKKSELVYPFMRPYWVYKGNHRKPA